MSDFLSTNKNLIICIVVEIMLLGGLYLGFPATQPGTTGKLLWDTSTSPPTAVHQLDKNSLYPILVVIAALLPAIWLIMQSGKDEMAPRIMTELETYQLIPAEQRQKIGLPPVEAIKWDDGHTSVKPTANENLFIMKMLIRGQYFHAAMDMREDWQKRNKTSPLQPGWSWEPMSHRGAQGELVKAKTTTQRDIDRLAKNLGIPKEKLTKNLFAQELEKSEKERKAKVEEPDEEG